MEYLFTYPTSSETNRTLNLSRKPVESFGFEIEEKQNPKF